MLCELILSQFKKLTSFHRFAYKFLGTHSFKAVSLKQFPSPMLAREFLLFFSALDSW